MQCGDVARAQLLFSRITEKNSPMYGAMMKGKNTCISHYVWSDFFRLGYIKNSMANQAIHLFHQIENPDRVNTIILFNACAQLETSEALNLAKKVSKQMPKSFHCDPYILCSLLDALMKCGDVTHARSLFDRLTKKTVSMYAAMMKGNNDITGAAE